MIERTVNLPLNGVHQVDGKWEVGFCWHGTTMVDLGRWEQLGTAKGIFSVALWFATGRGRVPPVGSSYRTFVEGKLHEAGIQAA
jgi:hypothetical protein